MQGRLYPLTADDGTNVADVEMLNPCCGACHIVLSPGIEDAA